ncbi:MAG: rhodanese-like domain-containing protein [Isosphaeraceae bacterium]
MSEDRTVTAPSSVPVGMRSISPARLYERIKEGAKVELIDVRTPAEHRAVHAAMARVVPLQSLDPKTVMASRRYPDEPLYVICKSGGRSSQACAAFAAAGFGDQVVDVEGGTLAWAAAGLPVVKGRYMLPLDRQVQTVTGLMILFGCLMGYVVNPLWYLLAGWCGLGLFFAGTTGICPLGALLARAPWNQTTLDQPSDCCA